MVFIYIEKSYSIEKERHKNVAVVWMTVRGSYTDGRPQRRWLSYI